MVNSSVQMIEDSISPEGIRLCSLQLRYWRPIHAELMTHRVFSRNARSSRAVPVATLLKEPIFTPQFGMNKRGMQSTEDAPYEQQQQWAREWKELADTCRDYVERWGDQGMHKQWANRPLEWFGWIDVLVTSTDWDNFFALRADKAAAPELQMLAEQMALSMVSSTPRLLMSGEWHLPYVTEKERDGRWGTEPLLKLSTARCARLSYKPFDGNSDINAEMTRHDQLVVSRPVHASPAEHQATPDVARADEPDYYWTYPELHGNFHGWIQYRKTLANEQVKDKHYGEL